MNGFHENPIFNKLKTIAKAACVIMAVFTLTLFGGCDLISSLLGKDNDANKKEDVVKVTPLNATIEVGETVTLTATSSEGRAISWVSENDEVATVEAGEVTGVSEGTAVITASDGKKMANCEITVIPSENPGGGEGEGGDKDPDVPKITLKTTAVTITEGDYYNLTATAPDGAEIVWGTSNEEVATVVNGKVTAVREGVATISASCATAQPAFCKVTVIAAPKKDYKLVWSDEFDGNSLDMTKWDYQVGTRDNYHGIVNYDPNINYWGNGELQYYTDGANLKVSDGVLQITAKRQSMGDRAFTSSRITTRDKYAVT